jgi:hypothetical protein
MDTRSTFIKEFVITDKFGIQHPSIMVGILDVNKFEEHFEDEKVTFIKGKTVTTVTAWSEKAVSKEFNIGLSITNPSDVYNYDDGVRRATGRALKPKKRLGQMYSESRSMLGVEMCYAILEQQTDFVITNPELFFKGAKAPAVTTAPVDVTPIGETPVINPT